MKLQPNEALRSSVSPAATRVLLFASLALLFAALATGAPPAPASAQGQASACAAEVISFSTDNAGVIEASDCEMSDLFLTGETGRADVYRFELPGRGRVSFQLSAFGETGRLLGAGFHPIPTKVDAAPDLLTYSTVLNVGTYFFLVHGEPDGGPGYSIAASFTPEPAPGACGAVELGKGTAVAGQLDAGDCLALDHARGVADADYPHDGPADRYFIELSEPGTLSLNLQSDTVLLRAQLFQEAGLQPFARFGATGPAPATAAWSGPLPAGRYELIVSASDAEAEGGYTLNPDFTPAGAACEPAPLADGDDIGDQLALGGCRMAYIPGGGLDPSPAAVYRLRVPQDLDGLDATVVASGFRPAIRMYTSTFAPVAGARLVAAAEGQTQVSISLADLDVRTYYLVVEVADQGLEVGPFTLDLRYDHGGADCSLAALSPGQQATGTLEASDCALLGAYDINDWGATTRMDSYVLSVAERGFLQLDAGSSETDLGLIVYDDDVRYGYLGDDPAARSASLGVTVLPGDYRVLVFSTNDSFGAYTLDASLDARPAPDCAPAALGLGATVNGVLDNADCYYGDRVDGAFFQAWADAYRLTLPERGRLDIDMRASELDAYLELRSADGATWIEANSDVDETSVDARISRMLPPGDYLLIASTDVAGEGGAYQLEASLSPVASGCGFEELALPSLVSAELEAETCLVFDLPGGGYFDEAVRPYTVVVPQFGELRASMFSFDPFTGVDPWLELYDAGWRLLDANDDIEPGLIFDAEIVRRLGPGVHHVVASTSLGGIGDFDLELEFDDSPPPLPTPSPTPVGPGEATPTPVRGETVIHLPWVTRGR